MVTDVDAALQAFHVWLMARGANLARVFPEYSAFWLHAHMLVEALVSAWLLGTLAVGVVVQWKALRALWRGEYATEADGPLYGPHKPPLRELDGVLYRGKFDTNTGRVSSWVEAEVQSREPPRVVR